MSLTCGARGGDNGRDTEQKARAGMGWEPAMTQVCPALFCLPDPKMLHKT